MPLPQNCIASYLIDTDSMGDGDRNDSDFSGLMDLGATRVRCGHYEREMYCNTTPLGGYLVSNTLLTHYRSPLLQSFPHLVSSPNSPENSLQDAQFMQDAVRTS